MNDLRNPYIAGAPVVETSMFFGREDVFNWIERSLEGKFVDHILVLHGQRRVGKTSVIKQIPNFLPQRYIQVFFDLQGRTNTTLPRFLWWLAREIVRTLRVEHSIQLPRPVRTAFEEDPETFINDFFPSLKPALGDRVLLLTFDEFDTLDRSEIQETLAIPLIDYLRRLMGLEGLSFIFSIGSSGNKLENMQASYTDFFKSALYRKISFLTKDDSYRLITKPVEGVLTYGSKAIDRIYEITSGHPYFTQLMCHELFSLCQKTGARTISMGDVDSVLDDVIERGTVNLKFVWDEATDLEKWILATLAQIEVGSSTHHLHGALQGQHIRFSEPDIYSAIIRLRDKDILNRDNDFVVHLLLLWLQRNRPLDRVREELLETNPIANHYLEIANAYRDQGQFEKALENYQNVLVEDPKNLRAQVNIGLLQHEAGLYEQAETAFRAALGLDPEDIQAQKGYCDACLAWGDQLKDQGEIEQAIHRYQDILADNPNHNEARARLATLHRDQAEAFLAEGQDEAALVAFQTALSFTPEDEDLADRVQAVMVEKKNQVIAALVAQAEKNRADQDWDGAISAFNDALLIAEGDKDLQDQLTQARAEQRDHQLATWPERARGQEKAENWADAVKIWEQYAALNPPDLEEAQAALAHARRIQSVQDKYRQASQALREKAYPHAIDLLREVIQVDPTYKDATVLLTSAVRASRKVKPNWRRITWAAVPILLVPILWFGYLGLKQNNGWETARSWLGSFSIEAINPFHKNTPTPELEPAASRTPTRTVAASPSPTVPTHTPTPSATEAITLTPTKFPTPTATPRPGWVRDFTEPILDYIQSHPPTFEEDFSNIKSGWGNTSEGFAVFTWVENNVLKIEDNIDVDSDWFAPDTRVPGLSFPTSGLFNASDFGLQFDFEFGDMSNIGVQFRSAVTQDTGYRITFSPPQAWTLTQTADKTIIARGRVSLRSIGRNNLLLIAKGTNLSIFLDAELIYGTDDLALEGTSNKIVVLGNRDNAWGKFDNFKFWNLEGVELPTSSTSEQPDEGLRYTKSVFQGAFTDLDWGTNGLIAAIGAENNAVILDASTGEINQDLSDPEQVFRTLAWHPNGETLTLGTASGLLRFYRFQDTWQGPWDIYTLSYYGGINDISYTLDGSRLAAVADGQFDEYGGEVGIWDTKDNNRALIFKRYHYSDAQGVDWMPDGNTYLTVGKGGFGFLLHTLDNIYDSTPVLDGQNIQPFDISPDGSYLAIYRYSSVKILTNFEDQQLALLHGANIQDIAWSPDSQYLATAGVDGVVNIWDISNNLGKSSLDPIQTLTIGAEITTVVWSPDGTQLAAGDADGNLWVWDMGGD